MSTDPQYSVPQRQVTTEEVLAALLPDSPAGALDQAPAPAAPMPTVAELLQLARQQGALDAARLQAPAAPSAPAALPVPLAAPVEAGPLVPRWAVGTAVVSVGIGGGALLLSYATHLLAAGAAAMAAGISAGAPLLLLGAVLVAAIAGRRGGGRAEISQTITQTVTQHIRAGGRR